MRRKDREITDIDAIIRIIDKCDIIRIGLNDGDYPYIVPLNFGYSYDGSALKFYLHGALSGKKAELMRTLGRCSFELDNPIEFSLDSKKKSATMLYESVMGKADIIFIKESPKKEIIMDQIMNRNDKTRGFPYNKAVLERTAIVELDVTEISGKANLKRSL